MFRDRFLIADVKMKLEQPAERWFWFDPPFHRNQGVLLYMQPDGVWRIDFQLGWDVDPDEEKKPRTLFRGSSKCLHTPRLAWKLAAVFVLGITVMGLTSAFRGDASTPFQKHYELQLSPNTVIGIP